MTLYYARVNRTAEQVFDYARVVNKTLPKQVR
jgi:hypothetical protein